MYFFALLTELTAIFKPFCRGRSSRRSRGLGLGLAISGDRSLRVSNYYLAWGLVLVGLVLLLNLAAIYLRARLRGKFRVIGF